MPPAPAPASSAIAAARATASTASLGSQRPEGPGQVRRPSSPASAPTAAAATTEPAAKNATVTPHLDPRARSPSGVMLASIDSPHGDHAERSPATTPAAQPIATGTAAGASSRSRAGLSWLPSLVIAISRTPAGSRAARPEPNDSQNP